MLGAGGRQVRRREAHRLGDRFDVVEASRVPTQDHRLHPLRELGVAELLPHLPGDLERPEGVDLTLWRPVEDGVGAPEDVVLAEGEEELAEDVRRLVGSAQQVPPGRAQVGVHVGPGLDPGATNRVMSRLTPRSAVASVYGPSLMPTSKPEW